MKTRFIKKIFFLLLFRFFSGEIFASVPEQITFASIQLNLSNEVRADMDEQMKKLTAYAPYINTVVERAMIYFPIMQEALQDENVPDDFKFLAIHESALNANAVSSSQAVGFWQFKDFTAREMGLEVNDKIDERKHIYQSSRAAAKYLKINNRIYNNWIYAMLSYYTGTGGAKAYVKESEFGKKEMDLDRATHWYIVKTLAFKLVFEEAVKNGQAKMWLEPVSSNNENSLTKIAEKNKSDVVNVKKYNPWALSDNLPSGKNYTVYVPHDGQGKPSADPNKNKSQDEASTEQENMTEQKKNPPGTIISKSGDTLLKLSLQYNIPIRKLKKWNGLHANEEIVPGKIIRIIKPSKEEIQKAKQIKHQKKYTVQAGDTLYSISKKFNTTVEWLRKKNHLKSDAINAGHTLKVK